METIRVTMLLVTMRMSVAVIMLVLLTTAIGDKDDDIAEGENKPAVI